MTKLMERFAIFPNHLKFISSAHIVYLFVSVYISGETAIITLHYIKWLEFVPATQNVYWAVGKETMKTQMGSRDIVLLLL